MRDSKRGGLLSSRIRELADSIPVDVIGFANADPFADYGLGDSPRRDPRISLADAKTIVVVGVYIGGLVLPSWNNPGVARTSRLFLSGYFNDVVRELEPIAALLRKEGYAALICDDSRDDGSILPLKLAAVRAGLGWQGRHSLLVTEKYGTFLALGGILTNAEIEPGTGQQAHGCRGCTRCQEACPLGALEQPYALNKARCLSYRLQRRNPLDDVKGAIGNQVMDCEICQDACPWNRRHLRRPLATAITVTFQREIREMENFFALPRLAELTEREYVDVLGRFNTGIPFATFHRNVLLALQEFRC